MIRRILRIAGTVFRFALIYSVSLAVTVAGLVYLTAADQDDNEYIAFFVAIFIVFGSILAAAAVATVLHRWFTDVGSPAPPPAYTNYGDVFSRYVTRFAWIISPIASSYGILRIIEILR